jgi:hypothetical protein
MRRGEQWVETGGDGAALADGYPTGRADKIANNGSVNGATSKGPTQIGAESSGSRFEGRAVIVLTGSWDRDKEHAKRLSLCQ